MKYVVGIAAALLLADIAVAHPEANQNANAGRVGAVASSARPAAAAVDAFHAALRSGNTKAALSHLAENALIYEAGGVERGRQEYASHHLGADSAFSQAVPSTVTRRAGEAVGNIAWIATEGRTTGTFKGKAVDRVTTETMVLRRQGNAWKIVHIHWSSAAGAK
ncbi:MAG: nuclear transport factor 2 family protein [Pseudomonadota bacterium]|nr:nuclear transport factor 2 family protein [Pseudomonadota bacterium]